MSSNPELPAMPAIQPAANRMNLARDMLQALGLAALAGVGTALAAGLVVVLLASGGA
jgi:hypothetical protein